MKKYYATLIFFAVLIIISGCKSKKSTAEVAATEGYTKGDAVCIWDNIPLREDPGKEGKWITSVSLGERCKYLNSDKEETNGGKKIKYLKVSLQDGKEGWVQSDFIVLDGTPGVITRDAVIYSRPDLLTKTDKSFSRMDIVGVMEIQDDFVQISGKRKNGKWIETGWIKPANISYSDVDIAVAKYATKAMAITDAGKREAAIKEIVENNDLQESAFIADLKNLLIPAEDFIEAEVKNNASDSTDNVTN